MALTFSGPLHAGGGDESLPVRLQQPTRSVPAIARRCSCSVTQAEFPAPLLDRIDIHIEVPPVHYADLASSAAANPQPPFERG